MTKKIAIIGNGWVGKAQQDLFPEALVYVRNVRKAESLANGNRNFTKNKSKINECDIAFVCVPTPVIGEGKLDTSIVEECLDWLETPLIVIRSTVNPGDCDRWQREIQGYCADEDSYKQILMQPEYLGETPAHPLLDTKQTPFLIIGGEEGARRQLIDLYQNVYNATVTIREVSLLEAEVIKISENRAISFKVAQCQELYDVCERAGINYNTIREAVYGDDPRFNLFWTFVFPDKRGFNSKCIPKDVYAWCAWAESLGYEPKITRAILEKNKEWIK